MIRLCIVFALRQSVFRRGGWGRKKQNPHPCFLGIGRGFLVGAAPPGKDAGFPISGCVSPAFHVVGPLLRKSMLLRAGVVRGSRVLTEGR